MKYRTIHLTLPEELLAALDQAAAETHENRSNYIRLAIVLRVRRLSIAPEPPEDELLRLMRQSV